MRFSKIKKKHLIKEYDKILYCNKKNNKSYCTLHIGIVVSHNRTMPPTDLVLEIQKKYPHCSFIADNDDGNLVFVTTIKSVATCSKNDTFDEKKGKTVAYSKAQMKAYDLAKRMYATISLYHNIKHAEFEASWMTMVAYYNREVSFLKGM